jgi:hypothetical protein
MSITISGGKAPIKDTYLTLGWQWAGPKAVTAEGLRRLLQPGLPGWNLSQPPKIETFPVALQSSNVCAGPEIASGPGAGSCVRSDTKVRSKVTWNIKKKDGTALTNADIGAVRSAIRANISKPIQDAGFIGVGAQPGAVKFTGGDIVPPLGYGLAGVALIALAANIRNGPTLV